jgi:thymidylate kinase
MAVRRLRALLRQMNLYLVVEHVLKMSFEELQVVLFDRSVESVCVCTSGGPRRSWGFLAGTWTALSTT